MKYTCLLLLTSLFVFSGNLTLASSEEGLQQLTQEKYSEILKEAESGDADAQFKIGIFYQDGALVDQDPKVASEWFLKASNGGHVGATNSLGRLYANGLGVERNPEKAVALYELASERGSLEGRLNLATAYLTGRGIKQDTKKGIKLMTSAAKGGLIQAQHNLGQIYQHGMGVDKNYKKAFKWLSEASNQGFPEAQYGLAGLYMNGNGTKKSVAKAMELYEKSANAGNAPAMFNMGVIYRDGIGGTAVDFSKSATWFKKGADQGHPSSKFALGVLIFAGKSDVYSEEKAVVLISESAQQGYKPAVDFLNNLTAEGDDKESGKTSSSVQASVSDVLLELWGSKEAVLFTLDWCISNVDAKLGENVALKTKWQKENADRVSFVEEKFTAFLVQNKNQFGERETAETIKATFRKDLENKTNISMSDPETDSTALCSIIEVPISQMTQSFQALFDDNKARIENEL